MRRRAKFGDRVLISHEMFQRQVISPVPDTETSRGISTRDQRSSHTFSLFLLPSAASTSM